MEYVTYKSGKFPLPFIAYVDNIVYFSTQKPA